MQSTPHEQRLRVRYGETDQMGVVHHANYLTYFEEGRTRLMADLGASYAALEGDGVGLPVRRVELRYRAPARYEQELVVRTWVDGLRAASVRFRYEIARACDDEVLVTGMTELACVDLRSRERGVIPLPDTLVDVLRPLLPE